MALKEEVEALLMRYDKKEFNLSESERLAMHQGEMNAGDERLTPGEGAPVSSPRI